MENKRQQTQFLLNDTFNNIYNWITKNDLIVNTSKTYFTVFRNINSKINRKSFKFTLNNSPIAYKDNIKYLGIMFDTNLNFKSHINYLITKLYKVKSTINFLKHTYKINSNTLLNYSNALFYSQINYCNSIWASNYKTNVKKIQTLQNLTRRTIYNYSYDKRIKYNELKLLDIKKINTLHILIYMYKYKNNLLPSSFDNLIKSKTYKYNFRHKKSFDIGKSKKIKNYHP